MSQDESSLSDDTDFFLAAGRFRGEEGCGEGGLGGRGGEYEDGRGDSHDLDTLADGG